LGGGKGLGHNHNLAELSGMQYSSRERRIHIQTGMQVLDTASKAVMMNSLDIVVNMSDPNTPIVQSGASVCTNVAALQFRKSARGRSRSGKRVPFINCSLTVFNYFAHRCPPH